MKKIFSKKNLIIYTIVFIVLFLYTFSYSVFGGFQLDYIFRVIINIFANKKQALLCAIPVLLIILLGILFRYSSIDKLQVIKKLYSTKAFLVFLIIFGIIISVVIPIYQAPDELTHINMLCKSLGLSDTFFQDASHYSYLNNNPGSSQVKVSINNYFNFDDTMSNIWSSIPQISVLSHLPQSIIFVICSIFHAPTIVTCTLCECAAVVFYSFVAYFAIKITPIKKPFFCFVVALPICIQQMGSFSYDSVLLPLCYFLLAYILYIKFEKKTFGLLDLLIIIGLTFYIAIIKLPYALIFFAVFSIPAEKLNIKIFSIKINNEFVKKYKKFIIVFIVLLLIIGCCFLLYFCRSNDFVKIIIASLQNLPRVIFLIFNSFFSLIFALLASISGNFGWLDTPSDGLFSSFVLLFCFIFLFYPTSINKTNNHSLYKFKTKNVILYLTIGLCIIALFYISMISWTIKIDAAHTTTSSSFLEIDNMSIQEISEYLYKIDIIQGVQGRYFVPVILIMLLPLSCLKITNNILKFNYKAIAESYYCVEFVYVFILLITRYWVF